MLRRPYSLEVGELRKITAREVVHEPRCNQLGTGHSDPGLYLVYDSPDMGRESNNQEERKRTSMMVPDIDGQRQLYVSTGRVCVLADAAKYHHVIYREGENSDAAIRRSCLRATVVSAYVIIDRKNCRVCRSLQHLVGKTTRKIISECSRYRITYLP